MFVSKISKSILLILMLVILTSCGGATGSDPSGSLPDGTPSIGDPADDSEGGSASANSFETITGTLLDENGDPVVDATVFAAEAGGLSASALIATKDVGGSCEEPTQVYCAYACTDEDGTYILDVSECTDEIAQIIVEIDGVQVIIDLDCSSGDTCEVEVTVVPSDDEDDDPEDDDPVDDDTDNDGVLDDEDNCPDDANEDQIDTDEDGIGNACDEDDDNDGVVDDDDNCPIDENEDQSDVNANGVGDICEVDADGDGIGNDEDNCPLVTNSEQEDMDDDGLGDVCDDDIDDDGALNTEDNCPETSNPEQADTDGDGAGDLCDFGDLMCTYSDPPIAPPSCTSSTASYSDSFCYPWDSIPPYFSNTGVNNPGIPWMNSQTCASTTPQIYITFSKCVNLTCGNSCLSFYITDLDGNYIPTHRHSQYNDVRLTLQPGHELEPGHVYKVTVSPCITDYSGLNLSNPSSWYFHVCGGNSYIAAPKDVSTEIAQGQLSVSWNYYEAGPPGFDQFNLYWGTSPTSMNNVIEKVISPFTFEELEQGNTYYFGIKARRKSSIDNETIYESDMSCITSVDF